MEKKALVDAYLSRLGAGDIEGVLNLFTPNAIVHSPLYGSLPATAFYPKLAADTAASEVTFKELFVSTESSDSIALRFQYRWSLANGKEKIFDCVDVIRTAPDGLISELTIIYDTHPRPL